MKQVTLMIGGCLATWLAATLAGGPAVAIFFGMLGPLVAVGATWLLVERAHRLDPARVGPLLMSAFAVKLVFFGVYVLAVTRLPGVDAAPFAVSFVGYFIALYIVQAVLIRGLSSLQPS